MNLNSVRIKQEIEVVFYEPPRISNNEPIVIDSDSDGSDVTVEYNIELQELPISSSPHSPIPSTSSNTIRKKNDLEFRNNHDNYTSEQNSPIDIDELIYNNDLIIKLYKDKIARKELAKSKQSNTHPKVDTNNSLQPDNVEYSGNSHTQTQTRQNVHTSQPSTSQPSAIQPSTSQMNQHPRIQPSTSQLPTPSTSQTNRHPRIQPSTSELPTCQPSTSQTNRHPRMQPSTSQMNQHPRMQPSTSQLQPPSTSQMNQHPRMQPSTSQLPTSQPPEEPRPSVTCPICLGSLTDATKASTVCGHIFCMDCIKNALRHNRTCPTCRKPLRKNGYHQIFI